ncbi:hypothetical protein CIRG_05151 [Coccidioides immitis RMSCC 2394]|uniref:Uncharacterized protein n=1 Tax=Coccidioides immitis RMSCC 2394 TaxID=404692 RepID=A0A0J6YCN6_COCIT|nr:hypothetical protein CIRG_05151 [Coccidioides immitis RMSCC 2394]
MDTRARSCFGHGGANSFCCRPSLYVERSALNPEIVEFEEALDHYLEEPTCLTSDPFDPLSFDQNVSLDFSTSMAQTRDLGLPQDLDTVLSTLVELVQAPIYTALQTRQVKAWDALMEPNYPALTMKTVKAFMLGWSVWKSRGALRAAYEFLCNLAQFNARLKKKNRPTCKRICDVVPTSTLCNPEDDVDHPPAKGPSSYGALIARSNDFQKRNPVREYHAYCPDGSYLTYQIFAADYPSAGDWPEDDEIWQRVVDFEDVYDMGILVPLEHDFHTEHILEIQTIPLFFEYASRGRFIDTPLDDFEYGDDFTPIPCEFFDYIDKPIIGEDVPPVHPGGIVSQHPSHRIMDVLGSYGNDGHFWLLERHINGMKAILWSGKSPVAASRMEVLEQEENPCEAIANLQGTIAVFNYLNDPSVHRSFMILANRLRKVFKLVEDTYNAQHSPRVRLVRAWDKWFRNLLGNSRFVAERFLEEWIPRMEASVATNPHLDLDQKTQSLAELRKLYIHMHTDIGISMDGYEGN